MVVSPHRPGSRKVPRSSQRQQQRAGIQNPQNIRRTFARRGQVVTGQERLISLVDLSRSRRTRQALLALERLDLQTRNMLFNMQQMIADEIHGPRKRWSDPH